jgi:FkbM family methyltransferase
MSFVTQVNGKLPFEVSVTGRKRDALFRLFDPIFSTTTRDDVITTSAGPIRLDGGNAPERFLSYMFFNVLKHYQRSDLGTYIAAQSGTASRQFVDVGANLGMYSLIARMNGYSTYLVEPEPTHAAFLTRNAATLGQVISAALADVPGELPLYYEEQNTGATSLVAAKGYRKGSEVVPVKTFSGLVADGILANPQTISLVKVDVEGAETRTIAGMRGFFEGGFRPAVWCEVRGDASGRAPGSFREVMSIMQSYGYGATEYIAGARKAVDPIELAGRSVFDLLFEISRA